MKRLVSALVVVALAAPHLHRTELQQAAAVVHVAFTPVRIRAQASNLVPNLGISVPTPPTPQPKKPSRLASVNSFTCVERSMEASEPDALFGCELHLDIENYVGYALARDEVPQRLIDGALKSLSVLGWHRVEGSEALEPHEFADGGTGVKIWLYREGKSQAAILRDVGMTAA